MQLLDLVEFMNYFLSITLLLILIAMLLCAKNGNKEQAIVTGGFGFVIFIIMAFLCVQFTHDTKSLLIKGIITLAFINLSIFIFNWKERNR